MSGLFSDSLARLEGLDLLDAAEFAGAPKIRRLSFNFGDFVVAGQLLPYGGRDYAYSIRREVLDTAVIRQVQQRPGVELREGFAVTGLLWRSGRVVGIRGRQAGGAEERLYAPLVIGADGKGSTIARMAGAPTYQEAPGRSCVYYAYYEGFRAEAAVSAYRIGDEFSAMTFPADAGLTVVAVAAPARYFGEFRAEPERAMESRWRSVPILNEQGNTARRETPVKGQGPTPGFLPSAIWSWVGARGRRRILPRSGDRAGDQRCAAVVRVVRRGLVRGPGRRRMANRDARLSARARRRDGGDVQPDRDALQLCPAHR